MNVWLPGFALLLTVSIIGFSSQDVFAQSVSLSKTADPDTVIAGDNTVVTYTFESTNNVGTAVVCSLVDSDFGTIFSGMSIANGATRMDTEMRVENSNESNTATLTCTHEDLGTFTDTANESVLAVSPSVSLDKTANKDGGNTGVDPLEVISGTDVTYVYKATNTGDTALSNCQVSDNLLGNIGSPFSLAPGAMNTVTSAATQINADTTNIGTVTCDVDLVSGETVDDMDDALVDVVDPMIMLDKTANKDGGNTGVDPLEVISGTDVTYVYKATNTGDVPLNNCQVSDNLLGNIGSPFNLAAGAMNTVTSAATQINADTTNTGTVTCDDVAMTTPTDMDDAFVDVVDPMIMLDKTCSKEQGVIGVDPLQVKAGEDVFYAFKVTNTGDVPLNNCQVSDPNLGGNVGASFNLAPGAMNTVFSTTAKQYTDDFQNTGTVMCDAVAMETPAAQDTCDVDVGDPEVSLMKIANPVLIGSGGQIVTYTFDATNTGDVPLKDCNITDDQLGSIASTNFPLGLGDSETFQNSTEIFVDTKNTATIVCLTDNDAMEMVMDTAMANVIVIVGGEFLPIDTTALFLAGIQSSVVWILPTAAGLAGAGYYLVKFRNKNE